MPSRESEAAFSFVAGVVQNFEGQPFIHRICQSLIDAVPENDDRLRAVEVALLSTGALSGEFGRVEAYLAKKEVVASWLEDPRRKVRAFTEQYSRMLDNHIASEQQQAEERQGMRGLDFDGDEEA